MIELSSPTRQKCKIWMFKKYLQVECLRKEIDRLQKIHGDKKLKAIYGAGCIFKPDILFLFMNPTARNISAYVEWRGIRAPWIGTKNVWELLYAVEVLSSETFLKIKKHGQEIWTEKFASNLYEELSKKSVYMTNLAKCTQKDARALKDDVFKIYLRNTLEEIYTISPNKIISFGNQVSSILLGKKIKVSEYKKAAKETIKIKNKTFDVYPVHYPVGQGMRNMKKSISRIKYIMQVR